MANPHPFTYETVTDLRDMLWQSAERFGTATAFREKKDGYYQDISYGRFVKEITALGTALRRHIVPKSHVLIVGKNSYHWALAFATLACGAGVPVPTDAAASPEELAALAAASDATAVLYAAEDAEKLTALPGIVSISFSAFPALIAEGCAALDAGDTSFAAHTPAAEDVAAIFYTAGASGASKGVMLSHGGIAALLMQAAAAAEIDSTDIFLSVLPASHATECVLGLLLPLYCGARIAFAEGISSLMRNMREVHPTTMITVPYLAEALLGKFWRTAEKAGTETDIRRAIALTDPMRPLSARRAMKKRLLADATSLFGGRLERLVVIGDFLPPSVQKGFRQIGIAALPGYSVTECGGLIALGRADLYRDGTAGLALQDSLVDIYNARPDGSGEIRYKGASIMLGYYKDENHTKEVLRRGRYYTGDIGRIDKDGFLHIIGRKHNSFERADGSIVCPEEAEALLMGSSLISQCAVLGVPNQAGDDYEVAALIYPNRDYAASLFGADITEEELEDMLGEWIRHVNTDLPAYKRIALFALRKEPLPRDAAGRLCRSELANSFGNG